MLKEESVSVAYEEYRPHLERVCEQHHRRFGGDLHDYLSVAHLTFVYALQTHDPVKSPFKVYLDLCVRPRLYCVNRRSYYQWWRTRVINDVEDCLQVIPQQTELFDVSRFAFELSDDAAFLIRDLFTNIVGEEPQGTNMRRAYNQRAVLRKRARAQGWTTDRLARVFDEIRVALGGGECDG